MRDIQSIKDRIVETLIPTVTQAGWSWDAVQAATLEAGFQDTMSKAVFPEGLNDVVTHFSDLVDRRMLESLKKISPDSLRMRDRVRAAILTRFDLLESMNAHTLAKATMAYWAVPIRVLQGQRVLWRSADRIWTWAGDTSDDYNRYTKRGLLSSLMMGTTLVWLDDKTDDKSITKAFLDRRLENIMDLGRTIGTIKPKLSGIIKRPV